MAALGAAGVSGHAAAQTATQEGADEYHETLQSDLTGRGGNRTLPAGEYVYGVTEEAVLDSFSLQGSGSTQRIEVDADEVPITLADRVLIDGGPDQPGDAVYRGAIDGDPHSAGDLLLAVAYIRSDDEDAAVRAGFRYEYTDPDGNAAVTGNMVDRSARATPGDEWMRYFFPVEVGEKPDGSDHTPVFEIEVGFGEQTVEFGGLALLDYADAELSLGTLPPYDYAGRSLDADWRQEAHERIEDIRKTDIEVTAVDEAGDPIPGASVELAMTDHAFDFGSAVSVEHITGDGEDDETYRETFLDHFNKAVVENGLKWPAWENVWDIDNDATRETLSWLDDRDIPTRGHYLLWEEYGTDGGGGMNVSADQSTDAVRTAVAAKIRAHADRFEGRISDWDMHNHPIWQSNFRDAEDLGWDAVDAWWEAADETTDTPLYTNEMGQVGGTWQQDAYYEYISHLVDNDYPIDGIGFMAHHQQWWNQMMDMGRLEDSFDRFAEFDLPILITEFDIQIFSRRNAQDVAVQRDYTRDFLTMAFSHPSVEGIMSWGFWADDHWRPTGAYYDSDWTLRPNGEMFLDLVYDEWWTEVTDETDDDGTVSTRGFKGEYEIVIRDGDRIGRETVTFDADTDSVTVELTPGIDDRQPTDPDGDGQLEDVNGDGDTDEEDVVALLNNRDHPTVRNNPESFDFDDDGEITLSDIAALYEENVR